MYYPKSIPAQLLSVIFRKIIFRLPEQLGTKRICLSFDDGPHPKATPLLLKMLKRQECKAFFFMSGKNVIAMPEIVSQVLEDKHKIGLHGFEHLSGWHQPCDLYVQNVDKSHDIHPSRFFRPPYGHLSPSQYHELKKKYQIVYWSKMPGDFDNKLSDREFKRRILGSSNRDILVLHDWAMLNDKRLKTLEESIIKLRKLGFHFDNNLEPNLDKNLL